MDNKEYEDLINSLVWEGVSEDIAKELLDKSIEDGLLEPPKWMS